MSNFFDNGNVNLERNTKATDGYGEGFSEGFGGEDLKSDWFTSLHHNSLDSHGCGNGYENGRE